MTGRRGAGSGTRALPGRTGHKIAVSIGTVSTAAAVSWAVASGAFGPTVPAAAEDPSVAGQPAAAAGAPEPGRLVVAAHGLVPGDTVQRRVRLPLPSEGGLVAVGFAADAITTSLLDGDTAGGLQLSIDACSSGWTELGGPATPRYVCDGTITRVLLQRPVLGPDTVLAVPAAPAAAADLRVLMTLPSGAGNEFQGQASTLSFTFSATRHTEP